MFVRGIALCSSWTGFRKRAVAHVRSTRRYAEFPSYAALLGAAVWLFARYPTLGRLDYRYDSPGLLLMAGAVAACGAVLAFALGLVGVWRARRIDVALSSLAMVLACWV